MQDFIAVAAKSKTRQVASCTSAKDDDVSTPVFGLQRDLLINHACNALSEYNVACNATQFDFVKTLRKKFGTGLNA